MKVIVLIGAAGLTLASTSVQAQDLSGFRVEGRIGWETGSVDTIAPNPDEDEDEEGDEFILASADDDRPSFGGEIGYDVQLGRSFLVGAYGGIDFSDNAMCSEVFEDDLACGELDRTFTLGLRAGVPIGKSALIYAKGGYSNGKFKASYDADVTDNEEDEPGEVLRFSDTRDGYHAGAGFELGISSGVYAKLEYTYTDFGDGTYVLDEDEELALDMDTDRHQVLLGLGVRF